MPIRSNVSSWKRRTPSRIHCSKPPELSSTLLGEKIEDQDTQAKQHIVS